MVKGHGKRTPHTGRPTAPTKQFLCFFRYKFEEKGQSLFPKIEKGYNEGETLSKKSQRGFSFLFGSTKNPRQFTRAR